MDLRRAAPYVPSVDVRAVVVHLTHWSSPVALGPIHHHVHSVTQSTDGRSLRITIDSVSPLDLRLLLAVAMGPPRLTRSLRWGVEAAGEWAAGDLGAYAPGVPTGRPDDDSGPDVVLHAHAAAASLTTPVQVRLSASPASAALHDDLSRASCTGLPPIDDGVANPIMFSSETANGPAWLEFEPAPTHRWQARGERGETLAHGSARRPVSDAALARLGKRTAVHLLGVRSASPTLVASVVAHLACAGVVVRLEEDVAEIPTLLGPDLAAALRETTGLDPADLIDRETISVRLRRAALRAHGLTATRHAMLTRTGYPVARPLVSVLLMSRRPQNLPFAMAQVARQRGVDLEVVLVVHGAAVDHPAVVAATAGHDLDVRVLTVSRDTPFGTGLDTGLRACRGDLVAKWDDDDWYGPHHLADACLALEYSGSDAVGSRPRFVHHEQTQTTVVRAGRTERFVQHVTGGSCVYRADAIRSIGWRPVTRLVDLTLSRGIMQNGGRLYVTHGLGYCLRRHAGDHTWVPGPQSTYRKGARDVRAGLILPPEIPASWNDLRQSSPASWAFR